MLTLILTFCFVLFFPLGFFILGSALVVHDRFYRRLFLCLWVLQALALTLITA